MSSWKYSVLLVDDDESVRESLRKLLESDGFHVISVSNGVEALEAFGRAQSQFDLLLMDLNMPMKNGWVTLDRVRELNPHLPVFIITGLSQQGEMAEAAGASVLVEKPIDLAGLIWLIQRQMAASTQTGGHQEFPFYRLPAARDASRGQWVDSPAIAYNHWGLNE